MHLARLAAPLLVVGLAVAACSGSGTGAGAYGGYGAPAVAPASAALAAVASSAPSAAPSTAASTAGGGGYDAGGYGKGSGGGYGSGSGTTAGAPAVNLASTGLGSVLVDGKGMTLYEFTPDTATTSACTGGCATSWPPLAGGTPTVGTGLAAPDFGTLTRADGTTQVTFHGHPLYAFGGDTSAGQTNGQGVGGKWYAVGTDGNPIK